MYVSFYILRIVLFKSLRLLSVCKVKHMHTSLQDSGLIGFITKYYGRGSPGGAVTVLVDSLNM